MMPQPNVAVYESMLVEDGRIRLLNYHLERLSHAGISENLLAQTKTAIQQACHNCTQLTKLKVSVSGGKIDICPLPPTPATGVRLKSIVDYQPTERMREFKLINRQWAEPAERAAKQEGFDEPLLATADGQVGETTRANVFIVTQSHQLLTPPIAGVVPGVTRRWVLETHHHLARETPLTLQDLFNAQAVFLTTAGRGIVSVTRVDDHVYPTAPHNVVAELQRLWKELL